MLRHLEPVIFIKQEDIQKDKPNESSAGETSEPLLPIKLETGMPCDIPYRARLDFPYFNKLPPIVQMYLRGWFDPLGDGHCGFRAISQVVRGNQDEWKTMRSDLLHEIRTYEYKVVYGYEAYDRDEPQRRIKYTTDESCTRQHWMDALDLVGYATMHCWAIVVVGTRIDQKGMLRFDGCSTILPLRAVPGIRYPIATLWMYNNGNHWITLKVVNNPAAPPSVPPILPIWRAAHDKSVDGWDQLFKSRVTGWLNLLPPRTPQSNSPPNNPLDV